MQSPLPFSNSQQKRAVKRRLESRKLGEGPAPKNPAPITPSSDSAPVELEETEVQKVSGLWYGAFPQLDLCFSERVLFSRTQRSSQKVRMLDKRCINRAVFQICDILRGVRILGSVFGSYSLRKLTKDELFLLFFVHYLLQVHLHQS